jgi:ACR3 family arsenite efflux pump ArsB
MICGTAIGNAVPEIEIGLSNAEYAYFNFPITILLWLNFFPMTL